MNEVQVVCTVMSTCKTVDPDIPAMIGTSAALAVSGIPFAGPRGAARVGHTPEQGYLLNPSYAALEESEPNMVVAGTNDAVLTEESEAVERPEYIMFGGFVYAHQEMPPVIQACAELATEAAKPRWEWQAPAENTQLTAQLAEQFASSVETAYRVTDKSKRHDRLSELRNHAVEQR